MTPRVIGVMFALASTISEAIGQFGFKRAAGSSVADSSASEVPEGAEQDSVKSCSAVYHGTGFGIRLRWIAFGFGGFILDGLLWSATLKYLDLTIAHPLGSLVFVNVAVFSRFVLREKFSTRRWAGIACILAGALLVASDLK